MKNLKHHNETVWVDQYKNAADALIAYGSDEAADMANEAEAALEQLFEEVKEAYEAIYTLFNLATDIIISEEAGMAVYDAYIAIREKMEAVTAACDEADDYRHQEIMEAYDRL